MTTVHSYSHSKISDPLRHVQNDKFKEARRPKNVVFYPNGKPNFKPQQMRITPHKYNSFNDLLKDLTKTVKLPFGVRRVFTPVGGTEIDDLDDLEDGNTYLCASFERFKPASYGKQNQKRPEWGLVGGRVQNAEVLYTNLGYTPSTLQNTGSQRGAGFRQYYYRNEKGTIRHKQPVPPNNNKNESSVLLAPPVKRTLQKGTFGVSSRDRYAGSMGHLGSRPPPADPKPTGYAKKFRIVYDNDPAKGYDFLFNEQTSDTFEKIMQYVSETLKQNLSKFFTLKNREVKSLRELYRCSEDVLIATANEQITEATLKAVREAIYSFKNASSSTSKNDSGFGEGGDSDLDRTPRLKPSAAAGSEGRRSQNVLHEAQRAKVKNTISPSRKPKKVSMATTTSEGDESLEQQPPTQQLSQVHQRKRERESKEKELQTQRQTEKDQEMSRKKKQQARLDNENRRRLKRLQSEKPKMTTLASSSDQHPNKENRKPPAGSKTNSGPSQGEIMIAENAESKRDQNDYDYEDDFEDVDAEEVVLKRVKPPVKKIVKKERRKAEQLGRVNGSEFDNSRLNSLETAAMVKHDKTDDEKLREQAEKAEQKRRRLLEEKERQRTQEEEERKEREKGLRGLHEAEQSPIRRTPAKQAEKNVQFEEANFIKKKKVKAEGPKMLSFESEEKILKDAQESEKERAMKERERNQQNIIELEAAEKKQKDNDEKDNDEIQLAAEAAAKQQNRKAADKVKQDQLVFEEAETQRKKAENDKKKAEDARKAEEEEKARLAEEAQIAEDARRAEEARKAEQARKAEEERRKAEEEEKARLAEEAARKKAEEEEEAEKARKAAALEEAARLRKAEEERQEKEAEEKARKEREAEAEAERLKKEEEEKEAAEKKKREKEEEAERKRLADEKAKKEREAAEEKRKQDEAAKKAASEKEKEKEKSRPKGLILPIYEEEEIERKYELKKKMGDGNFANVFQALLKQGSPPPGAPETMKEYAVKQIDKSKVVGSRRNTSSKVQMLKNEIDIMKACDHPNIAKLYEAYETEKHVYLIMEFVKGGDLFDAISENIKFDEPQSSLIIRHLAEALDYLHSRKIVHRDIKPENLLVDKDEKGKIVQVKLGDFGLAMHVKEKIYSVCGTPTYVAPEILAETGYGLEVDNWATGVISYILLCGFPPFRSIERNQDELFDTIQRGEFEYISPYWDNISDTAKDLIDQLLVVETRKRMKSPGVLKHKFITTHKT